MNHLWLFCLFLMSSCQVPWWICPNLNRILSRWRRQKKDYGAVQKPAGSSRKVLSIPYAPCMEYLPTLSNIYPKTHPNVGKYSSTMEHLGMIEIIQDPWFASSSWIVEVQEMNLRNGSWLPLHFRKTIWVDIWGFPKKGGIPPNHHPFIDGIFHDINHPLFGTPKSLMENPSWSSTDGVTWKLRTGCRVKKPATVLCDVLTTQKDHCLRTVRTA